MRNEPYRHPAFVFLGICEAANTESFHPSRRKDGAPVALEINARLGANIRNTPEAPEAVPTIL